VLGVLNDWFVIGGHYKKVVKESTTTHPIKLLIRLNVLKFLQEFIKKNPILIMVSNDVSILLKLDCVILNNMKLVFEDRTYTIDIKFGLFTLTIERAFDGHFKLKLAMKIDGKSFKKQQSKTLSL
jgi:hypothetical protein